MTFNNTAIASKLKNKSLNDEIMSSLRAIIVEG